MPVRNSIAFDGPPCGCCGTITRTTQGDVSADGNSWAEYLVRWTDDKPIHGVAFLLTPRGETRSISALYSFEHNAFMVVGADGYVWGDLAQPACILSREEVIGTARANLAFALLDELWLHEPHLHSFVRSATPER